MDAQKCYSISEMILSLRQEFSQSGYQRKYLLELNLAWSRFEAFANEKGVEHYTPSLTMEFLDYFRTKLGVVVTPSVRRAANALTDYYNFGQKLRRTMRAQDDWNGIFETQFSSYFEYFKTKGLSRSSEISVCQNLKSFQEYLEHIEIRRIENVESSHLYDFLEKRYFHTQKKWKNRVLRDIRHFLEYLHAQGVAVKMFEHAYPSVRAYEDSSGIPNVFTKDEISRMLAAVDRGGPLGKRDYAILLLSARYGLRASDIVNLRFENLDWKEKSIRLIQSKTGAELALPLLEDVGWALIDYLEHGRPVSPHQQVFVSHNAPHEPFLGSLSHLTTKYMNLAKIPVRPNRTPGLHALRHGLATQMLRENVPISSIKEVLGHASAHTTARYQRMDMKQLALCALEVPDVSA